MDPTPAQVAASAAQLDALLRARRTRKLLDGARLPGAAAGSAARAGFERALRECVAAAGWAPFHYAATELLPEPWRFTVLDRDALDAMAAQFPQLLVGRLPQLLAGAGALVQISYVAEPERPERNPDHHSATAAAAMVFLLAAEARGLGSYWCTARVLDDPDLRRWSGVAEGEQWIGGIFVGCPLPSEREAAEGLSGKLRDRRTSPDAGWMRWPAAGRRS